MDLNLYLNNPSKDYTFDSIIPKIATREPCLIGIDEAGRGPVLGPMVYGLAYFPVSLCQQLKQLQFADSKTLTEAKREEIFEEIGEKDYKNIGWFATILSPVTISNSMFKRSKYNLNALSHDTAISLINRAIDCGVRVTQVFVDTVGPADKYEAKLKAIFPSLKIKVANKADSLYPIVSAASIVAKVIRDRTLKQWKFIEKNIDFSNVEYGSGYPSDPTTKSFLSKNIDPVFGFPTLARFSWSTVKNLLDEKAIECEWEEEEDDEQDFNKLESKGNKSILNFFKPKEDDSTNKIKKQKLHSFFRDRNLEPIKSLNAL